jgi:hypothetical protein
LLVSNLVLFFVIATFSKFIAEFIQTGGKKRSRARNKPGVRRRNSVGLLEAISSPALHADNKVRFPFLIALVVSSLTCASSSS